MTAVDGSLPKVDCLFGDRRYDADWFRDILKDKGIRACIPGRKRRRTAVKYDKCQYKRRNRIEIMFGRLKDWRRVAARYDRCPNVFLSAIALAAIVIYWLCVLSLTPPWTRGYANRCARGLSSICAIKWSASVEIRVSLVP